MHAGTVLAGLDWNVTVRGILVVLVGASVLMGSVWLLLATNLGTRVGTLMAFTGFFGWMTLMATIWWIFGIGWKGQAPSWRLLEINYNELDKSPVTVVRDLVNPDKLPSAYSLVVNGSNDAAKKEFGSDIPADRLQGLTPAEQAAARKDWQVRNEATTLSELAAVAPDLTNPLTFGGHWKLQSTAQGGEAQASASAALVAQGTFSLTSDFKLLDVYSVGGKPKLKANPNRWDRISHKLGSIIHFRHPPHYAVVQVRQVIPQQTVAGQAPPRPIADTNQPIVSVVMERNLGSLRVHDGFIAVGSLLLFTSFATMLHYRDKESMARRAALAGKR